VACAIDLADAIPTNLLVTEFDQEVNKTRAMLERVPDGKTEFAPHPKSMTLGRLAPHVAELAGFGLTVLTTSGMDFSSGEYNPLPFESAAQLVRAFDDGVAKVRDVLAKLPDSAWTENWGLSYQGRPLFNGPRFVAYRQMFLNHIIHHRAQLGVYLRMNGTPLPPTYGPSADETLGF
jgi:uncharacterized damage-inducible protein DinB